MTSSSMVGTVPVPYCESVHKFEWRSDSPPFSRIRTMTDRKEYMAKYYEKNKAILCEVSKKNRESKKTYNQLLQELTDSRIKLEATMLQDVLKYLDIKPDHIALLWKEYQQKTNAYVVMSNVDDHKQPFINWMESR